VNAFSFGRSHQASAADDRSLPFSGLMIIRFYLRPQGRTAALFVLPQPARQQLTPIFKNRISGAARCEFTRFRSLDAGKG
jgi:hypothetical protein